MEKIIVRSIFAAYFHGKIFGGWQLNCKGRYVDEVDKKNPVHRTLGMALRLAFPKLLYTIPHLWAGTYTTSFICEKKKSLLTFPGNFSSVQFLISF